MPKVPAAPVTTTAVSSAPGGLQIPPGVPPPHMASSNPDLLVSAGLANQFNGRVLSVYLLPRKLEKGKKAQSYELFVELNIRADDPTLGREGIVTEYYKADNLNQWVPSRSAIWDGTKWVYTPAGSFRDQAGNVLPATLEHYMALHLSGQNGGPISGFPVAGDTTGKETAVLPPEDWKGWFPIPGIQNSRASFMKGTKWAQFLDKLKELSYYKRAPHVNDCDFREFLVGVYAHWVRFPFVWTGGQKPDDAKDSDTLCMAEILDLGPISGAGGPVTTASVAVPAVPAAVAAPVAQAPAPAPVPVTQVVQPAAQPAVQAVQAPIPAPVVVAAPAAVTPPSNDIPTIEVMLNESLTRQAQAAGAAGVPVLSALTVAYEELNAKGLNGAQALVYSKNAAWLGGDDRTFFFIEHKGMIAATAEFAMALR